MSVEVVIRRRLSAADASPFIVHVDLLEVDEVKVRVFAQGRYSNIAKTLAKYPAASA